MIPINNHITTLSMASSRPDRDPQNRALHFHDGNGSGFELAGELDGLNVEFSSVSAAAGITLATWRITASGPFLPPVLELSFSEPQRDMQVKWFPLASLSQSHHFLPYWGPGGNVPYGLAHNAPVLCCMNQRGENRLAFAFSEAKRFGSFSAGPHENGLFIVKFHIFGATENPAPAFTFSLYLDRRPVSYIQALAGIAEWYAGLPGYTPAAVPPAAEEPLYSTWYQYQKAVSAEELTRELPFIAELGMKAVILDDGWQCEQNHGGGNDMTTCGDWHPYPGKFPDLAALVERFHEYDIRFMVWLAVPFVGCRAEATLRRLHGKFLSEGSRSVFDPRYPDVREYLIGCCERMVREWNLDGLKLDFIDSFRLSGPDPAAARDFVGCDTRSLSNAIDLLLDGIVQRLTDLRPDILLEFRQHYNGPAMRKYGNIFRASDCAFDLLQNRVRTTDLRLLAGHSAVHSDMVIWAPAESTETAALQLLNVIFNVPQISVRLQGLSAEHRRMLRFWLAFWREHRETLLRGRFEPEHPELSYPVIRASGERESVIGVYESGKVIAIAESGATFLVNATHESETVAELPVEMEISSFNVYGDPVASYVVAAGLRRLTIPTSGYAKIEAVRPTSTHSLSEELKTGKVAESRFFISTITKR